MRRHFDNGIVTPQPVFIIGTYDKDGKANAMNVAWGGQVGPKQVSLSLSQHKTTDNLKEIGAFTVSFADEAHVAEADYVGIASGAKDPEKMEKSGLTAVRSEFVNAPYFEELPVAIECKVVSITEEYGETRVVGEIVGMTADEFVITDDKVDLAKLQPIIFDCSALMYRSIGDTLGGAWNIGKKLM